MAYAEIEDLTAGWRILTDNEEELAIELLERASAKIDAEVVVGDDAQRLDIARIVCCDMVRRAMKGGDTNTFDPYGSTQAWTPTDEPGELKMRRDERRLFQSQRVKSVGFAQWA